MYFSGIREAYDYQTPEGWWVIYATFPEKHFYEWMVDFPYDLWVSTLESHSGEPQKEDWDITLLIKDPVAYLHFRSRWYTDAEYMICRADHDRQRAEYHFSEVQPDGWKYGNDLPIHDFTI